MVSNAANGEPPLGACGGRDQQLIRIEEARSCEGAEDTHVTASFLFLKLHGLTPGVSLSSFTGAKVRPKRETSFSLGLTAGDSREGGLRLLDTAQSFMI